MRVRGATGPASNTTVWWVSDDPNLEALRDLLVKAGDRRDRGVDL